MVFAEQNDTFKAEMQLGLGAESSPAHGCCSHELLATLFWPRLIEFTCDGQRRSSFSPPTLPGCILAAMGR